MSETMGVVLGVVLGLLSLGLAGVAVVLFGRLQRAQLERADLMARMAASEQARQGLESEAAKLERATAEERERSERHLRELQTRLDAAAGEADALRVMAADLRAKLDASLAARADERESLARQQRLIEQKWSEQLDEIRRQSGETFKSLAGATLAEARAELMKIADEKFKGQTTIAQQEIEARKQAVERLLSPISETLKKTDEKLAAIEKERTESYAALRTQVQQMVQGGEALRTATERLGRALRDPKVRGQYGEIQLKKVAELAGMRAFCDFTEQSTTVDADGNRLRPDMIVKLPNKREVAIDAKANLKPYLDAIEATDPAQVEAFLKAFADGIANQASALARKGYWKHYENAPEFVVMFVPGDQFVDAALSRRPDLLEVAASQRVLLASPSTLIGLLRAVHVGFQEQTLADEALELRRLGAELHDRASAAFEHVAKLGKAIESAGDHFNNFVGSYERRLEPTLRKFEEANVKGAKELPELKSVSTQLRLPSG